MESIRNRVRSVVKDPATAEGLSPYYGQYCKVKKETFSRSRSETHFSKSQRPCFHDEYLETFNRPNVSLVDTKGAGVERITEKGVVAQGKEYEVDCIIVSS